MPAEISIITITYNDPRGLAETLASLEPLRDLEWEQVIVDSSPSLNEPVLKKSSKPFLHVVQEPTGVYAAMNAGLRAANGEIVWFLNGGDRLSDPDALAALVRALRADPAAELAQGTAELWRDGRFLYLQRPRHGIGPMLGINRVCQQAMLYRKSLFARTGPFSESYRLVSDYVLHLRAIAAGAKTIQLDKAFVRYDMSGQSSNVEAAFDEFRRAHEALAREGKLPRAWLHALVWRCERLRIRAMKRAGATLLGPALRSVWRNYRRMRG